jgi:superfamily II DNA or RNA helicase
MATRKVINKTTKYTEEKVKRKTKKKTEKLSEEKPEKKKKKKKKKISGERSDRIILKDKIYIPMHALDVDQAIKEYTHHMFEDRICASCEYKPDRPTLACNNCPMEAYKGSVRTCSEPKVMSGGRYLGFPIGDRTRVEGRLDVDFDDFEIKDKRVKKKFDYPVRMKKSFALRDHQERASKKWRKKKHGLIVAPPRSGKCVTGDTIIHTRKGAVPIKSLFKHSPTMTGIDQYLPRRPFDILTGNGVRSVTHIYRKTVTRILSMQTHRGFRISGVEEHPLLVLRPNLTLEWVELQNLLPGDYVCINKTQGILSRTFTKIYEKEAARLLGYITGAGYLGGTGGIKFTAPNAEVAADFKHCLHTTFRQLDEQALVSNVRSADTHIEIFVTSREVRQWFSDHGQDACEECVPTFIQTGTKQIQRNYLLALIRSGLVTPIGGMYALQREDRKFLSEVQLLLLQHKQVSALRVGGLKHQRISTYLHLSMDAKFNAYFGEGFSIVSPIPFVVPYVNEALGIDVPINHSDFMALNCSKILDPNLSTRIELLQSKDYLYEEVISVEPILGQTTVYDVTVPEGHHYVGNGIISHNTPTMLDLCISLGYRTIILANQHDFLNQFLEHIEDMTNLPALERKTGKKLYGFAKKPEDFDTLQICLCTFQQFTHKSKLSQKRFRAAKRNFGTMFVDEVHRANADSFASVINSLPAKYKGGVTGTDKRKDGKEFVVRELIGPVAARVSIPQLRAKFSVDIFDGKPRSAYKGKAGWVNANKWLSNQDVRTEMILAKVGKDLKNNRSIVIPCYFKEQIFYLTKRINDLYGAKTAESFVGGGGAPNKRLRNDIILRARAGETRVVVGTRSLIQLGINIPAWDTLYVVAPISNEPNWKQESSRILTPMDDKNTPLIRFWVDPHLGQSLGCFCNTYRQTLQFGHEPTKKARETAHDMLALNKGKGKGESFDPGSDAKPMRDKSLWGTSK